MRILVKESGALISDLIFDGGPIDIGSQPMSKVHLPDLRVQDTHAVIKPDSEGRWVIEHLAGGAKTWINGRLLRDTSRVSTGDQITIEDYTLNVFVDFQGQSGTLQPLDEVLIRPDYLPLPVGTITKSASSEVILNQMHLEQSVRLHQILYPLPDVAAVMNSVLNEVSRWFQTRAAWIGIRRGKKGELECRQGQISDTRAVLSEPLLHESLVNRCVQRGLSVLVPNVDDPHAGSLIAVPIPASEGRLGYLYLDSHKNKPAFSSLELDQAIAWSIIIGRKLEDVIESGASQREAIANAHNNIVRTIQAKLDPLLVPQWPDLQIALHCSPGQLQSGDVYDLMELPNGAAAILIGRVYAQPDSTVVALVESRSAFRIACMHGDMPHVIVRELNWLLGQHPDTTMACAVVLIDPATGALLYCIAGNIGAFIIGQSGSPRHLRKTESPMLGETPQFDIMTNKGMLGSAESLVLYTPGLRTLTSAQNEPFDEERLTESLCDGFGVAARTALNETISDLSDYLVDGYKPEDHSILMLHRESKPSTKR